MHELLGVDSLLEILRIIANKHLRGLLINPIPVRYLKLTVWTIIISYLCFAPASEFKNVHIPIPHFDKVVHFGMFFIAGLLIGALNKVNPSRFHKLTLPLVFVLYAAIIEITQHYCIYMRNGDFIDWLADILGLCIGIAIFGFTPPAVRKLLT